MATDVFITFKDSKDQAVKGESLDDKFKGDSGWSEVLSWSCGATQSTTLASQSTGAGGGKVALHDFSFSKMYDVATNELLKNMFAGEHYKKASVVMREAGGGDEPQKPYLCIAMENVFVTNYSIAGSTDRPIESWTIAYGKISYHYAKQKDDGSKDGFTAVGWDQFINKPWTSPDKPTDVDSGGGA